MVVRVLVGRKLRQHRVFAMMMAIIGGNSKVVPERATYQRARDYLDALSGEASSSLGGETKFELMWDADEDGEYADVYARA